MFQNIVLESLIITESEKEKKYSDLNPSAHAKTGAVFGGLSGALTGAVRGGKYGGPVGALGGAALGGLIGAGGGALGGYLRAKVHNHYNKK